MRDLIEILKGLFIWVRYLLTPVNIVVILLLALLILSGCSSKPEPAVKVVIQEVKIPVYVPCLDKKDLPVRTDYVTINIRKNDNPVVKVRKLDKLTQQQNNYIGVLEKALNGCSEQG
ncbi:hypothetical protein phiA019_0112 [Aeromonas phage phiA019]|nr:hypothetical protein phiA009_0115 [Aeromonas phage phiA009]ULG01649.1 hypothetical protein phiA019_0112 [Aeromonas phage phiA019]